MHCLMHGNSKVMLWRSHVWKLLDWDFHRMTTVHNNCENVVPLYSIHFCKCGNIQYYIEKMKTNEFQEMPVAKACCIWIEVSDSTVHVSAWHSTCRIRRMYIACVLHQLHNPCWTWPSSTKSLSRHLAGSPTPPHIRSTRQNTLDFTLANSPLVY